MDPHESLPWPYKGAVLFTDNGSYKHTAHIQSQPSFYGFTAGYKCAADELILSCIEAQKAIARDAIIFPVIFLYRHYLELSLKEIYIHFSGEEAPQIIKTLKSTNHSLIEIWKKVKPLLEEYTKTEQEQADIEAVEDYINQFHNIDCTSFAFRYPFRKNLEPMLSKRLNIDLNNLKERINELDAYFSGTYSFLAEMKDIERDYAEYLTELC